LPAFTIEIYNRLNQLARVFKSIPIIFLILSLNILNTTVFAQSTYILDKTTRFEKIGPEEGLSTGYTTCMHQDKYGFIWIGTQYGLNLYDGNKVEIFSADQKNPNALYEDAIISIFEDIDGTMWFCTYVGISKYNRASQTFTNYIPDTINISNRNNICEKIVADDNYLWIDADDNLYRFNKETGHFVSFGKDESNPSNGMKYSHSINIFLDRSGTLWVCSGAENKEDFAISRFNKKTETFIHFQKDPSDPGSFIDKPFASMIEGKDGRIWIATWGGGLLELIDKKNGKFKQHTHADSKPYSILDNKLLVVYEDSLGNIWTGGKNGFSLLNKNTSQFTNFKIPPLSYNASKANYVWNIDEDNKGELWLTTRNGFFRFNHSTLLLRHYLQNPEDKSRLSSNIVTQIMHDHSNQDWILTQNNGINKLNHFANSFKKIDMISNDRNSLPVNFISRIFEDSNGFLWLGTYGEGLIKSKLNKAKELTNVEHYFEVSENPKSINGNWIFCIGEDKEQTVWIGTSFGLYKYNANSNEFERFEHNPEDSTSISFGSVESIFEDSYGTFWVGTRGGGLNIMDRKTGKFIRLSTNKKKLLDPVNTQQIREIYEDSQGELWFGGLYLERLNRKDSSFIHYFSDSIAFHEASNAAIWNIIEDDSANLWMSSYRSGIIKLQRNNMTFINITTDYGLPSNTIMDIEIDDNGFIWATTTNGLSRVDPRDYSIQNYDETDGLASLEFIENSSFKDKDGWLYFGTREGFSVFHPDSIKDNTHIPPVYITGLNVSGNAKYFDKPLYETSSIDFQYDENDFSFDFVALDYVNPKKNKFAYMLEGYDEDWNYVGNKRTANYTNLDPGTYTFHIKASNNNGYWNEEGASLEVIISPPFWKTWWAYGIYIFIFVGLLYLLRRYEVNRLNLKQSLELEQVETEKLAELDIEKNKFFSNISHEFRTPLTLILGPLDRFIGKLKSEEQKQELNLVRRNARRLQVLINQLLSLSKLESGKMKLRARRENIVKLANLFLQSFHSMAESKGIKLEFESDADEHLLYIDTLKFEKITNNLLSNAFKFTEKGGKIKIGINAVNTPLNPPSKGETHALSQFEGSKGVIIKFSDTGIGIQKEELPHVFDRFYQVDEQLMKTNLGTGIGLSLTKELIELHHGTITVDSEAGMGTTFSIFLPMGKDHLSEDEIIESNNSHLEIDDELLNDDYLFVQDNVSKTELKTDINDNGDLPLLLIVEDNDDMRSYIKSYLVNSYQILEAPNGSDGAKIAIDQLPDLIVSDLMMPIMDGNEMTQQLKNDERTSHIPIILLTAKSSIESKLEGLETGADDFLTKPFDAEELLVRIKNLIEGRRKLRTLLSQHIGDVAQTRIIKDSSGKAMNKLDEQFLEKAKNLIDEHMANPDFSVEILAQEMAMSRVQLHRKLKSLTDNSTTDLIRNLRLIRAAKLLEEGELNVTQISYEVGISSLSYFTKAFKEKYGVTPSDFSQSR